MRTGVTLVIFGYRYAWCLVKPCAVQTKSTFSCLAGTHIEVRLASVAGPPFVTKEEECSCTLYMFCVENIFLLPYIPEPYHGL